MHGSMVIISDNT